LLHLALSNFWQYGSLYLSVDIGAGFLFVGLVGGLPVLVGLAAVNLWGSVSDRWHRRKPIILLGFLAQGITFLLYLSITEFWPFLIVTCLVNVFIAAAVPLANAYLTEGRPQKGGAVGLLMAASSLGWSIGAFSGSLLIGIIGMLGIFLVCAVSTFLGGVIILVFVRDISTQISEPTTKQTDTEVSRPTVLFISRTRFLLILCLAVAVGGVGVHSFSYFFGVYIVVEVAGLEAMVGLANSVASLAGLGLTLAAGYASDRIGRKPILVLGFFCYMTFWLIYATIFDPWIATLLWFIPLYPLVYTAGYSAAADVSSVEYRGRAMTFIATAQSIGSGVGPIIGGIIAQLVTGSLRGNMIFAAIMNAAALLLVLVLIPESLRRTK
jgi:MFS family permease